jgi:hypothetical protein
MNSNRGRPLYAEGHCARAPQCQVVLYVQLFQRLLHVRSARGMTQFGYARVAT